MASIFLLLLGLVHLICSPVAALILPNSTLPPLPLPPGVQSSYVDASSTSGLVFHILSSACDPSQQQPLIVLLHGAPELAFTWRHIIAPLAAKGYCVVAPDQRGYGRTTGWDTRPFDAVDLTEFHITNLVRDIVSLVYALGYTEVHSLISHDFGTLPGTYAPLLRPDVFKSAVQVSIPFVAVVPPAAVEETAQPPAVFGTELPLYALLEQELEALNPPRKHYQWYNSQRTTAADWLTGGPLGQRGFMRAYYFVKSHSWSGNAHLTPPKALTAQDLAVMPDYLILPLNKTMPEAVQAMLNGTDPSPSKAWISDADLDVFLSESQRTGYQGELNWYRVLTSTQMTRDTLLLAGRKITVPNAFITGANDWSSYLDPTAIAMYNQSCTDFRGVTTIPESGHWVPEEQPKALLNAIVSFLKTL